MDRASHLCGLVLAAGASTRMGRDKALLPWPPAAPQTTLLAAILQALQPVAAGILVVAGPNAEALAPIAAANGAILVRNPAPERGQFSSLQIGLRAALDHGCDAAIVTPVDCPPLSAASLELLRAAFDAALAGGQWAVAPEHNGRHGHPLFAGRALIDAFLAAPVTSNAREVRRAHTAALASVPVADPLASLDLNTPGQYAALAAQIRN